MTVVIGNQDRRPLFWQPLAVAYVQSDQQKYQRPYQQGGQAFESKGFAAQADAKSAELEEALLKATRGGELPVLCDTSPCLKRMQAVLDPRLKLYDPAVFVLDFLQDRLSFTRKDKSVALHVTCTSRKMGLEGKLRFWAYRNST